LELRLLYYVKKHKNWNEIFTKARQNTYTLSTGCDWFIQIAAPFLKLSQCGKLFSF